MIRFAIKAGLAGSVAYYISKEGVWKDSKESLVVYEKLDRSLESLLKYAPSLAVKVPNLPERKEILSSSRQLWNQGVGVTFKFLSELDSHVYHWMNEGYTKVLESPELNKLSTYLKK